MRIPISENEKGLVKITKDYKGNVIRGRFCRESEWYFEYAKKHHIGRFMTWKEFKERFPYRNHNIRSREMELTKYNKKYNFIKNDE